MVQCTLFRKVLLGDFLFISSGALAEALQRYVDQLQKTENLGFDLQKMFPSTWLFTCGLRWIW
jgi:hypothetical protein